MSNDKNQPHELNDEFIDALLRDMPKPEPLSDFERRRFEKLIDTQAAEVKRSRQKRRLTVPTSIAASVAIALGAVLFFHQHGTVGSHVVATPTPSNSAAQGEGDGSTASPSTGTPTAGATKPATPGPSHQGGTSGTGSTTGQYSDNPSSGATSPASVRIPEFETNLDYATDIAKVRTTVAPSAKPRSISSLDAPLQQCVIGLGISSKVLAHDRGYYDGVRVNAFFYGADAAHAHIILVDSSCSEVATI